MTDRSGRLGGRQSPAGHRGWAAAPPAVPWLCQQEWQWQLWAGAASWCAKSCQVLDRASSLCGLLRNLCSSCWNQ
eukprot:COSAG01_NODE_104_length_26171_cov_96.617612_14_plen_75_part_00